MEMTRREFNRLVTLGTGAELLPRIHFVPEDRKIGYCIVGLGRISMQHSRKDTSIHLFRPTPCNRRT